jgi:glycerol uptake facilitator-like aquaporin
MNSGGEKEKEISNKLYIRMYNFLVEFFGSLFFVYIILITSNPVAIGFALALVLILTKDISGGYLNPAVTIAMVSAGKLPSDELVLYCVAQILGGLFALEAFKRTVQ